MLQDQLFQILATIHDPMVDEALASAMPTADEPALSRLADFLIERDRETGKLAIVTQYDRLPTGVRLAVLNRSWDFQGALRKATELSPAHVIQIVLESRDAQLVYLVVELLVHGASPVRAEAGACLLKLARQYRDERGAWPESEREKAPANYRDLQKQIEQAVNAQAAQQQPETWRALAALAPRRMPLAWNTLAVEKGRYPTWKAFGAIFRRADDEDICRAMFAWVHHPRLRSDVLAGLNRAAQTDGLQHTLANAHLLLDAAVRAAVAGLNPGGWSMWIPKADEISAWPADRLAALPAWINSLPLSTKQQAQGLADLASFPDRCTRLAALRRLMALSQAHDPEADPLIARFCDDPDAANARIALRYLLSKRGTTADLPALLLHLVNSPHDSVRELAGKRVAAMGYERFWHAWPRLNAPQRLAAGRALIKLDPAFHQHVGKALESPDSHKQFRALAIIHGLNQGELFEEALLKLVGSADAKMVSAAIRAIGTAHSPQAIAALTRALNHPDGRVRANAIEGLQQARASANVNKLVEMAHDEESRPRANAIGALLEMRTAEALNALRTMLADPRPNHRASALWLVESMGLIEVATRVAELAVSDHDRQIKGRAGRVVHRLLEIMQPPAPEQTALPTVSAA